MQAFKNKFLFILCWLSGTFFQQSLYAQCATPISTFPYLENFESSNGNWTRSSSAHWEWGTIAPGAKNVITAAGGGQKCWIVGGLSGGSYNSGNSYLQSPCFNFSGLTNPEISLKIFWETEKDFDGANIQYSLDQGATWILLGSENSNSNCDAVNWYNLASVRFVGFLPAWSGNIQSGGSSSCRSGSGSSQWLIARHNMGFLAGEPQVIFRFEFGAGTICNDYEGFAIDDIEIREAPPAGANFDYTCMGNNTVDFINNSSFCQTSVLWNFDDLASGAANTSAQNNPSHTFSAPGTYTVSLTANFSIGPPSTITKEITILNVNPVITNPILCNGDRDGIITANVTGGNGVYTYNWNTSPAQTTATISNLSGNTYTVTVAALNACPVSSSVTLIEPGLLTVRTAAQPATCGFNNGSIAATATGGTGSYTYLWSNNETTSTIQDLAAGTYSLLVKDVNGCTAVSGNITVNTQVIPANVNLGGDTTICPGQVLILRPGVFASYQWQDNSSSPTYTVTQTGDYYVDVTNSAGCKGSDTIKVKVECLGIFFPTSFTPNGDGINETFGPVGDLGSIRDFNMTIYNRWGQVVFVSVNPFIKWDGKYRGVSADLQTFVWKASYRVNREKVLNKKGTVTLIR